MVDQSNKRLNIFEIYKIKKLKKKWHLIEVGIQSCHKVNITKICKLQQANVTFFSFEFEISALDVDKKSYKDQ